MAKIGLEYVVSAKLTETEGVASYSEGRYWGPSSSFSITPNASDVKDYGDNRVVATDTSVTNAGVSVELNENTLELESFLLGHAYDKEKKTMVCNINDIAPFVGTGCIGQSVNEKNQKIYRGFWLPKCQFKNPNNENTTKQESTAFNHSNFEGTAYNLENGDWYESGEFDTLEAAKTWLNEKANITA